MSWTDQVRRNAFSPSVHMAALVPTGRIRFNFLPQHQRNHQAQRPPNSSKPDFPFPVAKYPSSELLSPSLLDASPTPEILTWGFAEVLPRGNDKPDKKTPSSSLHQLRTRLFDQSKRGLWFQPLSRLDFRPALSRIDGCAGHPSPFRGFFTGQIYCYPEKSCTTVSPDHRPRPHGHTNTRFGHEGAFLPPDSHN